MLGSSEVAESGIKVSSRILRRYVLRGEQVEVATRQHWAKLAEPVITVIVGFFIVAWTSAGLERAFGDFGLYLWWVWFGLIGRLVWRVFEWRNEWFVATDKRLLLTYGLFTHKVAMMPLRKVTDLNYGRSVIGRMLGYGDFTLESAGQDQALRKINWLPSPDETYRRICDIIFGPKRFDSEDLLDRHSDPSTSDSEQTDVNHRPPSPTGPPGRRYTSDKIAAEGEGDSPKDWPSPQHSSPDALDDDDRSQDDVDAIGADDRDVSDREDSDWVVDGHASGWDSPSGGADDSWQTSRERPPSYQRVQPRPRTAAAPAEDTTGQIEPRQIT